MGVSGLEVGLGLNNLLVDGGLLGYGLAGLGLVGCRGACPPHVHATNDSGQGDEDDGEDRAGDGRCSHRNGNSTHFSASSIWRLMSSSVDWAESRSCCALRACSFASS